MWWFFLSKFIFLLIFCTRFFRDRVWTFLWQHLHRSEITFTTTLFHLLLSLAGRNKRYYYGKSLWWCIWWLIFFMLGYSLYSLVFPVVQLTFWKYSKTLKRNTKKLLFVLKILINKDYWKKPITCYKSFLNFKLPFWGSSENIS